MVKSFLHFSILVLIFLFILSETFTSSFAQAIVDTNKGNHINTKVGLMDGNWVETVFLNYGQVADWQNNQQGANGSWPKGTNHTYIDGVAIIVQAETQDPLGNFIHPLETNYYEFTRHDPLTGVTYGWWPLPGYANPNQSSPARSDDPNTWPDSWPDRLSDWDGVWNGYFGKGVINADLETFFVFDDNEDRQYILSNQFYPDTSDITRGGLGIQIKARGFQWNIPPVADVIFWHYDIINMGTTDYNKILFAQYVDWAIGGHGNSSNNAGDYDELNDISYAWCECPNGGDPGGWLPVGLSAYAFLESPGIPDDIDDNDTDGLHDEKRDNEASVFIEDPNLDPYIFNVFQDTTNFREFYGYSWRPHWDADENGNWVSYFDSNENGQYDEGEPLNDDLGTDGIGPGDEGYIGPDPDGTEGNGLPDQGEPNFGMLDKDESDQLGLTGFQIFAVHTYELHNDEQNWEVLSDLPAPHGQSLIGVNLANFFSSYFFSLAGKTTYSLMTGTNQLAGETQRYSLALMFALSIEEIFNVKRTIQKIYNNNYQIDSTTSIEDKHLSVPSNYLLYQNYPNPFNPITKIKYSIPLSDNVQIKVYDILGREIKTLLNEYKQAGTYEIEFDASNFISGVYFYSMQAGNYTATKKLILIK
jgi:hypothetical protein